MTKTRWRRMISEAFFSNAGWRNPKALVRHLRWGSEEAECAREQTWAMWQGLA